MTARKTNNCTPTHGVDGCLLADIKCFVRSCLARDRLRGIEPDDIVAMTALRLLTTMRSPCRRMAQDDVHRLAKVIARGYIVDWIRVEQGEMRRRKIAAQMLSVTGSGNTLNPREGLGQFAAESILRALDADEHCMVIMRLKGATWSHVCCQLGWAPDRARKRWRRMCLRLRANLDNWKDLRT